MKVLHLHGYGGGIAEWRLTGPARSMRRAGHTVTMTDDNYEPWTRAIDKTGQHSDLIEAWVEENVPGHELIVTNYCTVIAQAEYLVKLRHRYGIPIIVDIDDDLWNVPPYNQSFKAWHGGAQQKRIAMTFLEVADGITYSMPTLGTRLEQSFERYPDKWKGYRGELPPIAYLPNLPHADDWADLAQDPARYDDECIRIAFCGGESRAGDLNVLKEPLTDLVAHYDGSNGRPRVRPLFVGVGPEWAVTWLNDRLDPHANRAHYVFQTPLENYRHVLSYLKPDILVNPVETNEFNKSKSPLKVYEGTYVGAACCVTDWPTHDSLPKGTCLKVDNTPVQWRESLGQLVEDAALRKRLVEAATAHVTSIDIDNHITDRIAFYEKVIARGVPKS